MNPGLWKRFKRAKGRRETRRRVRAAMKKYVRQELAAEAGRA